MQDEKERHNVNPWTDIEKCIFLDRFLQHPKDFRKIASFLKNKSVQDCISFYYDSKQSVPYKAALKEHLNRKKRKDSGSWEATIQASLSMGAIICAGISAEKPLIFKLPSNDNTFYTRHFHPMKMELLGSIKDDETLEVTAAEYKEEEDDEFLDQASSLGNLFSVDPSQRKHLNHASPSERRMSPFSDGETSVSGKKVEGKRSLEGTRKSSKWNEKEIETFLETKKKYGKSIVTILSLSAPEIKN